MNLQELNNLELNRHKNSLNLIASENYPSPEVLELLGSGFSLKYGEGYPGRRYYAGNELTDKLELEAKKLALKCFSDSKIEVADVYDVNLQVLSGSPANSMVYLAMLQPGDAILSLKLSDGGHLSHLHKTSSWNKFFKHVSYEIEEVEANCFEINLANFENQLRKYRPKLTILGASSYPRQIDFAKLTQIAHNYGSLVLADIAHINGLIAAGLHPSPFAEGEEGADFVSMTTHKTFRGARGAMLFMKKEYAKDINQTVFPGTSGGPHFNKIIANTKAMQEIIGEAKYPDGVSFKNYTENLLINCKKLEKGLQDAGLTIISPSQNHLCLVKIPDRLDSLDIQLKLEGAGVICNRNGIPFDSKTAWRPSGLRFGTAALTSRGLTPAKATELGKYIGQAILSNSYHSLQNFSKALAKELNWWYG